MLIILLAFAAGVLSILAPCVLPVLPVIFGGGVRSDTDKGSRQRPLRLIIAMMGSLFVFTVLLIGTIVPLDLGMGIAGIIAYILGFGLALGLIVWGGRTMIQRLGGFADARGVFKRTMGRILLVTGLLIITGGMQRIEKALVTTFPALGGRELTLLDTVINDEKNPPSNQGSSTNQGEDTQGSRYRDYDPNEIPVSGNIVLFFHADRCPTCNEAEKNFLAEGIPDDMTILKVDYDTANDLRVKYRVLTQTSFVLIKPDGSLIKRRVGGRTIADLRQKINEATQAPETVKAEPSGIRATAYFAGGCFWCIEGPFEASEGVIEAVNGYAGGDQRDATYEIVSSGRTKHREAVKVVYDPLVISYPELLDIYRRQIDPTDAGGQFADRGYHYTTAIYTQTTQEQEQATQSRDTIAGVFDEPIAVMIVPFSSFYPAEDYHQDYYKNNESAYSRYKKGSGREDFSKKTEPLLPSVEKDSLQEPSAQQEQDISHLTALQKKILFEGGTEPPFDNEYWDFHGTGIYVDVIDGTALFSSLDKFDSGTGRPSFTRPIDEALVGENTDQTLGMERTEIVSSSSSGHLGHVFDDGPADTGGKRYCINSAALKFVSIEDMKNDARYTKYLVLFE